MKSIFAIGYSYSSKLKTTYVASTLYHICIYKVNPQLLKNYYLHNMCLVVEIFVNTYNQQWIGFGWLSYLPLIKSVLLFVHISSLLSKVITLHVYVPRSSSLQGSIYNVDVFLSLLNKPDIYLMTIPWAECVHGLKPYHGNKPSTWQSINIGLDRLHSTSRFICRIGDSVYAKSILKNSVNLENYQTCIQ